MVLDAADPNRRNWGGQLVKLDFQGRRRILLTALGLALLAVVLGALYRQVFEREFLQTVGDEISLRKLEIPAHRGEIRYRNEAPLAISTPVDSVGVDPRLLPPDAPVVAPLAQILDMRPEDLRKLLVDKKFFKTDQGEKERRFLYLKRATKPEVSQRIKELRETFKQDREHSGIRGIRLEREYQRFYPDIEVAAHVVGLTNAYDKGQEGLELSFDYWLAGRPGERLVLQDGRRQVVEEVEGIRSPEAGKSLHLSLDRRLQFLTYVELKRAVQQHQARGGTAVILDVETGEVLAMANFPSYNPNDRATVTPAGLRNRAVTDLMEPGSTIKPLLVATSLEAGKVHPNTPVDTSPGRLAVGKHMVRDIHNYGQLNVTSVITKSSNVGVTKLALELAPEYMWRGYQRFGLGEPTDSRLPGEELGRLPHFRRWSRFDQATLSFGYSLSVNALQLARAYAILAGDGIRRPVSLFKLDQPPAGERVLQASTAKAMREMMETVVSAKGTALRAAVPGYRVAGKTGTAKKAEAGGYAARRYQSLFAGLVPVSRPRLVMVVMIDEPGGSVYYGGLVAAPVFARVMSEALRLLNVPPDAELPPEVPQVVQKSESLTPAKKALPGAPRVAAQKGSAR